MVLRWRASPESSAIIVESLKEEDMIFGKFDVGDDFLLESYFIAWEVLYLFTIRSKAYVCYFTTLNFILPGKEAH